MEIKWILFAVFIVIAVVLVIYLIVRNLKDKDELVKFLNETEIEDKTEVREKD
jgi:uncharacterized membrane protein